MREVKYSKEVLLFFDKLFDVLIDKGYFSFYESSAEYLEDLVDFIEQNIENYPHKKAPEKFSKCGDNLLYIIYKRNSQTTWYIFFEKGFDFYFIRYITNNHIVGKYL